MKIAALVGIVSLVAGNLTASAAEPTTKQKVIHKVHHAKHRQARPVNPYAALERYRSMGFIGDYPGDYALRKSRGECVEDLGYGRVSSCGAAQ